MKHIILRLLSCLLIGLMLLGAALPVSALSTEAFTAKWQETQAHLQTLQPQVGSVGGEWVVLGLARAEALDETKQAAYEAAANAYVQATGSNRLHQRKSSDNSRMILALSAIGRDARSISGYDLTEPLNDQTYVAKQGVNGVIWALIALDSCSYPCQPGVREEMLQTLLTAQHEDGGWGLDETISDPDVTGMAIQALAPYRFYDEAIQAAIDRAVERLIAMQTQGGGYASYDDLNPESCAQVLTALCAIGIDPQNDVRFCADGQTLLDSLLRFSVQNGFAHTLGGGYNQMATEQAFYAMTAYKRLQDGKTTLYDVCDVQDFSVPDIDGDGSVTINDATVLQRFLAEFDEPLSAPQQKLADRNRSGRVDINDVTLLQRQLAQ